MEISAINLTDTQNIREQVNNVVDQILRAGNLEADDVTKLFQLYTPHSACENILKNVAYMCLATIFLSFMMMLFGIVRNHPSVKERRFKCCGRDNSFDVESVEYEDDNEYEDVDINEK